MDKKYQLPSLGIVIVNWNSGDQLFQCLRSVENTKKINFLLSKVIVVDNGSRDNSLENFGKFDLPLIVICNKKNLGFSKACNIGAESLNTDYILFLNPDTRLFGDSLMVPIEIMEKPENKNIGVSGIRLVDEKGKIARTCAKFPYKTRFIAKSFILDKIFPKHFPNHIMINWDHNATRFVDHVMGAFYLIRNNLFKESGGFDERFFVYLEDLDLSKRIYESGYKILFISQTKAFHRGGGTSEQVLSYRLNYSLTSRLLYIQKYFSSFDTFVNLMGILTGEYFTRIIYSALKGSFHAVLETIKGYYYFILNLPETFKKMGQKSEKK